MDGTAHAPALGLARVRRPMAATLAAGLAVACGALAVGSIQITLTVVLLILLIGIQGQSRTAGLMTLWAYWLLIPMVRRVLDLSAPAPGADPLSVLPFVATALLALMELQRTHLDRRAHIVLALAGLAFLIGLPAGLLIEPAAASFAALAYCAGLSGFVLGWGDESRSEGNGTLQRALAVALPALALYAIGQYFVPMSSWDQHWVDTAGIGSIGAPQEGHIRVFSTLNSYFTFAIVLAIGILLALGEHRRSVLGKVAFVPLVLALAFTYNRSTWLGLMAGLFVFVAAGRRRAMSRVVVGAILFLAVLVFVGNSNPTTRAFTQRVTSLGNPSEDVSVQERLETTRRLLPEAISQPVGAGLGQAGLASERLVGVDEASLVNVDDGYLALMYQSGPLALLLMLLAMGVCVSAAARASGRVEEHRRPERAALLATLVMLLVLLASGEVLFGISGVIFWYLCGVAVAATRPGTERRWTGEPDLLDPAHGRPRGLVQSGSQPGPSPSS